VVPRPRAGNRLGNRGAAAIRDQTGPVEVALAHNCVAADPIVSGCFGVSLAYSRKSWTATQPLPVQPASEGGNVAASEAPGPIGSAMASWATDFPSPQDPSAGFPPCAADAGAATAPMSPAATISDAAAMRILRFMSVSFSLPQPPVSLQPIRGEGVRARLLAPETAGCVRAKKSDAGREVSR
jgi:hypothetical protein